MTKYGLEIAGGDNPVEPIIENVNADTVMVLDSGALYFSKRTDKGDELVVVYNANRWLTLYVQEED